MAALRRRVVNAISGLPGARQLLEQYRTVRAYLPLPADPLRYRGYVGDMWDEMGMLQRDFLITEGLRSNDVLVDVACGSLRAGRLFIAYLDSGNYLGLDHHKWLIELGLKHEVPKDLRTQKKPEFVVTDPFDFGGLSKRPTYGIAQSLFSHLTKDDISLCLRNVYHFMLPAGRFYATFVPKGFLPTGYENPPESADDLAFEYDAEDILEIGRGIGWEARYIGDWGHPRGQEMLAFTKGDGPDAGLR